MALAQSSPATLTAEEAVAEALRSHYAIQAGTARSLAAEGLKTQAGLRPNPRLFLQSENTRFGGNPGFQYGRDADSFVYASQVIERGHKRERRIDLAQENVSAREAEQASLRTQIAARVLTTFWAAVASRQAEGALSEGLQTLERIVQYHRDRVKEGSLPEADLIRTQLEYQQVAISYQNAQQETRRHVATLFREMGVPQRQDVALTGDLAAVPSLGVPDLNEAVERRTDVRQAKQAIEQARAYLNLQSANAVPDPEVLAGYKRTAGFDTIVAGIQINLPVRNRNQGAISAASAEISAATSGLLAARAAARSEIQSSLDDYEQKQKLVKELIPAMRESADETRRIADAVYREGGSDLLRLLDAERVRLQAETLYIRILTEYRQASVQLQVALGIVQ